MSKTKPIQRSITKHTKSTQKAPKNKVNKLIKNMSSRVNFINIVLEAVKEHCKSNGSDISDLLKSFKTDELRVEMARIVKAGGKVNLIKK